MERLNSGYIMLANAIRNYRKTQVVPYKSQIFAGILKTVIEDIKAINYLQEDLL